MVKPLAMGLQGSYPALATPILSAVAAVELSDVACLKSEQSWPNYSCNEPNEQTLLARFARMPSAGLACEELG